MRLKPVTILMRENIEFLKQNFPLKGANFCAKVLGIDAKDIRSFCNYSDIKRLEGYKGDSKTGSVYTAKFISDIDEYSAYILGFIWADGYVSKTHAISLEIKKDDALEIKDIIMKTGEWKIKERQRYKDGKEFGKMQLRYSASSKEVVQYLIDKSFSVKSEVSPSKILEMIPDNLKHYFWRGFFDGDGNLYIATKTEFSFWGSYAQSWTDLEKLLDDLGIKYTIRCNSNAKNQKFSQIYCCNFTGVNKFIDYISQGIPFGLKRKRLLSALHDRRKTACI
jgi:intein/homing endonuclease